MIAFIINGLPGSRQDNSNELTNNMVNFPNNPPGLAAREREVIYRSDSIARQPSQYQAGPLAEEIRFKIPLPEGPYVIENVNPTTHRESDTVRPVAPSPVDYKERVAKRTEAVKRALPKIYAVVDGDNLASIAKKLYGEDEGNKNANIMRIFEANRSILESPDDIYVGQKLIIPPLSGSEQDKDKGILSSDIFKKVVSIGREHLLKKSPPTKKSRVYTVRENDSLWKIASEQLGDGSRYKEILKLNKDILEDEDTVPVGATLKIPAK
jgi:nucleoid-associated protein YgaU